MILPTTSISHSRPRPIGEILAGQAVIPTGEDVVMAVAEAEAAVEVGNRAHSPYILVGVVLS